MANKIKQEEKNKKRIRNGKTGKNIDIYKILKYIRRMKIYGKQERKCKDEAKREKVDSVTCSSTGNSCGSNNVCKHEQK